MRPAEWTYEILRAMGSVRMFRDRVVSMEQTQEIGERHIDLLSAIAVEALPGYALAAHGLDHESDHYWLSLTNDATGQVRRLLFTRMFLSDASRLPAVVADASTPMRAQIVARIREQAARAEIVVTVAGLLTEDERIERDEIEAEWRKKHEAEQAARRAEEERRARERQRQKQQEEARRQAQRERERAERAAAGQKQQQPRRGRRAAPPAPRAWRSGRRRGPSAAGSAGERGKSAASSSARSARDHDPSRGATRRGPRRPAKETPRPGPRAGSAEASFRQFSLARSV